MRYKVLVNPVSRGGRTLKLIPALKSWLEESDNSYSYFICRSREDLIEEAEKTNIENFDGLLIAGGDGTLHDVLQSRINRNIPLGIMPSGRGNDFIRNIGLPTNLQHWCKVLPKLSEDEIDLPLVDEIPFGSIASVGFDAMVSRMVSEGNCAFTGMICYLAAVIKTLAKFKPLEMRITLDDRIIEGKFLMAAVANGQYYGGGMRIAPEASMHDGLFDIILIQSISKLSFLFKFPRVFAGTHTDLECVEVYRSRSVKIEAERESEVAADGEIVSSLPAEFKFQEHKLKILA